MVKYCSADLTALQIARLSGLNRNTVNRYLRLIRERIATCCERESPFSGTVEVDDSDFGARHVKGKRGRGASGKTPVFGRYERGDAGPRKSCRIARKPRYKPLFAAR